MDIMQEPLESRVSPPPFLARFAHVDTAGMIRDAIAKNPEASPDDITRMLNSEGVAVSGIWVARMAQLIAAEQRDSSLSSKGE